MITFRFIVTILLIIPIAMYFFWILLDPSPAYGNDTREMLWLLIALPIFMANYYAWIDTHIIDNMIAAYKKEFQRKTE